MIVTCNGSTSAFGRDLGKSDDKVKLRGYGTLSKQETTSPRLSDSWHLSHLIGSLLNHNYIRPLRRNYKLSPNIPRENDNFQPPPTILNMPMREEIEALRICGSAPTYLVAILGTRLGDLGLEYTEKPIVYFVCRSLYPNPGCWELQQYVAFFLQVQCNL